MPSNHLILCCPLLLLPSIFPRIRVFSNESALCIRWPKYWSFRFNTRQKAKWIKKKKNWKQYKRPIGLHKPWQYTHNGDPERRRKRKGDWKGFWRNCSWKLDKSKEGNRDLGTGNIEGPIKDRPKQNYTKIPKIAEDKDKERILREAREKQKRLITKKHSSVQLSPVTQSCLFVTPWSAAHLASLHITQSLLKLKSVELVMPSNHLILCHSLLLLPSIFPSIRVFTSESVLHIRWPKYWSINFSISPSINIQD